MLHYAIRKLYMGKLMEMVCQQNFDLKSNLHESEEDLIKQLEM